MPGRCLSKWPPSCYNPLQTNCRDPQLLHLQNRRDFFSIYRRRRGESSFPFIGGALAAGGELVGVFSKETAEQSTLTCPLALSREQDLLISLEEQVHHLLQRREAAELKSEDRIERFENKGKLQYENNLKISSECLHN